MSARSSRVSIALGLVAQFALADFARAAELQAVVHIEPEVVAPGGVVAMTLVVTGGGGLGRLSAEPSFVLQNLDQVSPVPTRSEQFQWVNGESSRSVTLRWILRAQAAGEARVTGFKLQSGDEAIDLPDQTVTVDPNAPRARDVVHPASPFSRFLEDPFARESALNNGRDAARAPKVFVRSVLEPAEVFVGQQTVYSLYLYTQTDIASVDPGDLPDFQGFWARDLPRPGSGGSGGAGGGERVRPETVEEDGERYARVPLVQKALFPLDARTYEIPAIDLRLSARVPSAGLGGLFQQVVPVNRRAEAVRLVARPLPPAPSDFSGAVGSMHLEARLEPERLEVGQAATLTLSLAGEGNLQGVRDPLLAELADVRTFPPQQEAIDEVRGKSVRGRRTWKWVLVPGKAGVWTVPPISIGYFDPRQRRYETAASLPLTFTAVAPIAPQTVAASAAPPAADSADATAASADAGATAPARDWRLWLPWGLALGFASALALVLFRRAPRAASDGVLEGSFPTNPGEPALSVAVAPVTGLRAHELPVTLQRELVNGLDDANREARPRAFANAIEEVLRRWVDARWDVPPSTASARWLDLLADRKAGDEATVLRRLLEDLRYLRFAPELSSHDTVRSTALANAKRLVQY